MKIILDNSQQQEAQEQQQFVIIQSQSLAGKSKMSSEDMQDDDDEIVYVLKDENTSEQPNVIQLESNCVNQEQFVWIANEQGGDTSSQVQSASTLYTIKELNYAQVTFKLAIKSFISLTFPLPLLTGHNKLNTKRLFRCQQRFKRRKDDDRRSRREQLA